LQPDTDIASHHVGHVQLGSLADQRTGFIEGEVTGQDLEGIGHHRIRGKIDAGNGVLSGDTVEHDYNVLGQLQTVKLPGNVSVGYTYNSNGTLAGVTTAGGGSGTYSNYDPVTGRARSFALMPALLTIMSMPPKSFSV
jgi:YD repeat-containing protein